MSIEIKVPMLPESVADATVITWHKKPGERVKRDENLVDLETDKVVLEVPASEDGVLGEILKKEGTIVKAGEVLTTLTKDTGMKTGISDSATAEKKASSTQKPQTTEKEGGIAGPAARRQAAEQGISLEGIQGSGKSGRITRSDLVGQTHSPLASRIGESPEEIAIPVTMSNQLEKRVPMTRLRATIAKRLKEAQHNAAILTTFNEVNLYEVNQCRTKYKEAFEKKHGVRLGYMSFFTKATVSALKRYPDVNASIDGNDIIYHGHFNIGIAVSTDRGLVVPVIKDADQLTFADIERSIKGYADKAKDNQITMEDMIGGTFTITNGGVFGSLLNMPILNPPQSAILGMNTIQERPIVEKGEIVIRPMMYIALSYDHRLIDGKDSVGFLKTIKEFLEDPTRLLIDL